METHFEMQITAGDVAIVSVVIFLVLLVWIGGLIVLFNERRGKK